MKETAIEKIRTLFPDIPCTEVLDAVVMEVEPDKLESTLTRLKTYPDLDFGLLTDITAVDYLTYPNAPKERFAVVYTLRNWERNWLVQVHTPVADPDEGIPTCTGLWGSANWAEREVYDQYGIRFTAHPDLRRILNHLAISGTSASKGLRYFPGTDLP